jgi:hypothetical protein
LRVGQSGIGCGTTDGETSRVAGVPQTVRTPSESGCEGRTNSIPLKPEQWVNSRKSAPMDGNRTLVCSCQHPLDPSGPIPFDFGGDSGHLTPELPQGNRTPSDQAASETSEKRSSIQAEVTPVVAASDGIQVRLVPNGRQESEECPGFESPLSESGSSSSPIVQCDNDKSRLLSHADSSQVVSQSRAYIPPHLRYPSSSLTVISPESIVPPGGCPGKTTPLPLKPIGGGQRNLLHISE